MRRRRCRPRRGGSGYLQTSAASRGQKGARERAEKGIGSFGTSLQNSTTGIKMMGRQRARASMAAGELCSMTRSKTNGTARLGLRVSRSCKQGRGRGLGFLWGPWVSPTRKIPHILGSGGGVSLRLESVLAMLEVGDRQGADDWGRVGSNWASGATPAVRESGEEAQRGLGRLHRAWLGGRERKLGSRMALGRGQLLVGAGRTGWAARERDREG
jgi:hypothetical protein